MNLDEMVDDYLRRFADDLDREIHFFESLLSLTEAIKRAAMAETSFGKRSSHQPAYRFSNEELDLSKRYLLETEEEIRTCKNFEELRRVVGEAICRVYKNAVLYVYDTAWKIGANLKLEPDVVYLHAGTREGAKGLGLDFRRETIDPQELPTTLQRLRPIHVENFLCIYHKILLGGKNLPVRKC